MRETFEAMADRIQLLDKTKNQYTAGPMRPRLYEVFEEEGKTLETPTFEWMVYAGMGNVELMPASAEEQASAKELIATGEIVPTFEEDFFGFKKIRLIQHFDDVKFGVDEDNNIVIYDFTHEIEAPIPPDPVLSFLEARHTPAVELLMKRLDFSVPHHAVAIDSDPIQLQGGPMVKPFILNADMIAIRYRQRAFTPQ